MTHSGIIKKLERSGELPTLPAIALEINRLLENPETTMAQLAAVIEKDQAIVSKALKLVNSSFYGLRTQVSNIFDAVIVLGFNTIHNIVLSISMIGAFPKTISRKGFNLSEFWQHSIAVAMTSKFLSDESGVSSAADCFAGGILHDVGKLIIALNFTDSFSEIIETVTSGKSTFIEAEQKILKSDHTIAGAYLACKWKFPEKMLEVISRHHIAEMSRAVSPEVVIVSVSNQIVNHCMDNGDRRTCKDLKQFLESSYKLPRVVCHILDSSDAWVPELKASIDEACSFFLE